jgi:predicted DNA-binding transcriptional regulator AlpA
MSTPGKTEESMKTAKLKKPGLVDHWEPNDDFRFVTIPELARVLHISTSHLWNLISAGSLTEADGLVKYGRKMTRFHLKTAIGKPTYQKLTGKDETIPA